MPNYNEAVRRVPMPDRIKALPVSDAGFPIPWFVATIGGKPDFRVVAPGKVSRAFIKRLCWVCGHPLGVNVAMTLGPMCAINRTISEPGSHKECAVFSALACPFLSNPRMRRREAGLPEDAAESPGVALKRNPGAVAVWMTRRVWVRHVSGDGDGILFTFGDPFEVLWFFGGRAATREEVMASINGGLPLLMEMAQQGGAGAVRALEKMMAGAMRYLPPASVAA